MKKTIVALFDNPDAAEQAVRDLLAHGIDADHINVASPVDASSTRRRLLHVDDEHHGAEEPSAASSAERAGTGMGVAGLLVGAAFLAVPAVGPVLAAGPLLAGMAGASAGAGTEELPQRLREAGMPVEEAERYARAVDRGVTLVVLTVGEDDVDEAASILVQHGPIEPDEPPATPLGTHTDEPPGSGATLGSPP